ncbi:hypothetical protein AALO_G00150800 [Alosa alosa]|uniref:Fibrinogen C-terminal domain-containing protein n=1 Tax=Alosa alosa TaxID=278164 RepID=A0AAV6GEC0_9TELE|nr:hypothetical protein AALO_G00150800 [Alosa alosa]
MNPVSAENEKTGFQITELNPVTVQIVQKVDGMTQSIPHTEDNINNNKGQNKPQHPSGNRLVGGNRDKASNPLTGSGGGKQSTSPVDKGKTDINLESREQPWRTKRPITQNRPVNNTKTWIKPLLSTDTEEKTNTSSEDNINKTNMMKTSNLQTVDRSVATTEEKQINPASADNERTGIKVTGLNPAAVQIAQKAGGIKQPILHTGDNTDNTEGQNKPQHPSGDRPESGNRDKASNPLIGSGGEKQATSVDKDKKDSHLMGREQPWRTKRPITQDRPVNSTNAWIKPLLSTDTEEKTNTSSEDNINKTNIMKTSNLQTVDKSVGIGNRTRKVAPTIKSTSGEKQMDPVSTDNEKTSIKVTELNPVAVQITQNADGMTQPIPHGEDNINNNKWQNKLQNPSGKKADGSNIDEKPNPLSGTGGGRQSSVPSVDRGKHDSHLMSHEQSWGAKSKNTHGMNPLQTIGQSDNSNRVKEELKPHQMDELSEHLSEGNNQNTEKNLTTHLSLEGTADNVRVVKAKDSNSDDLRSKSLGKQSYRLSENRTDEERGTNESNTSMRQKVNISRLKKLIPFNLNKNQTKERQPNIMKQESAVVINGRRRKQDPVPLDKVTTGGESHIIPGSNNNSQMTDLRPPKYVEVTKYTDEVRGSKSLTVEGIQENYQISSQPESNNGTAKPAQDCSDYTAREPRKNGIFIVRPDLKNNSFPVLCEMESYGGGWTLLQRRYDGSISFNRSWNEYKRGFGQLDGEFWLGNDLIHLLTKGKEMALRIQLEDIEGLKAHATYDRFSVASELERYRLTVGHYSGTAGDALNFSQIFNHNQKFFTTPDRDNDQYPSGNCGAYYGSAAHHFNNDHQEENSVKCPHRKKYEKPVPVDFLIELQHQHDEEGQCKYPRQEHPLC